MIRIEALEDPRIADYVGVKESDLVKKRGLFVAEGVELVRSLIDSPFEVRSVFLSERRSEWASTLFADQRVFVAPQAVMNEVVGYPIHRGCLALGERGAPRDAADFAGAKLIVALQAVNNHDNVGGIFRNAAAFGVEGVLLDEKCADPLYRKAVRVSMGAVLRVPFARTPALAKALSGFTRVALTPDASAEPIRSVAAPRALLLGAEWEGLDSTTMTACEHRFRIPMAPGTDSLNVATASGIALFVMTAV